jgi:hypothetical protein
MRSKNRMRGVGCVAAAALAVIPGVVRADLGYDLRFSDGSRLKTAATGAYSIELWAQLSGTDLNHANDSLSLSYHTLMSEKVGGGAISGGVTAGGGFTPFNSIRSQAGLGSDLNGDGIADWGSTASDTSDVAYLLAQGGGDSGEAGGGAVGHAVNATTWEFKIATFTVNASSLNGLGETRFSVVKPAATNNGIFPAIYAVYQEDGTITSLNANHLAGAYGSFVSLSRSGAGRKYWDSNGTTAGAGGTAPVGTWGTNSYWGSRTDGTEATVGWSAGSIASFAAGADATGIYTVNVSGNQSAAGLMFEDGDVTLAGGTVTLTAPPVGNPVISVATGRTARIDSAIAGTAGFEKMGTGMLTVGGNIAQTANVIVKEGTLVLSATEHLAGLTVASIATARVATDGNRVLYTNTLSVPGTLDLEDNDLVVSSGNFGALQALVLGGYRSGIDTSATGIVSTTSQTVHGGTTILALFDNSLAGFADYPFGGGQTISASAIVGKYTYIGDTNMDGQVTPQDYTATDSNLGTSVPVGISWFYGDTNFDGNIDPTDYAGIDGALGLGQGNPLAMHAMADFDELSRVVPEVGSLIGVCGGLAGVMGRRRRTQG